MPEVILRITYNIIQIDLFFLLTQIRFEKIYVSL